jgi:hypothetical protein
VRLLLRRPVVGATVTDQSQRTAQAAQDAPLSTIRDKAATDDQPTASNQGLSDPVAARVYFVDLPPTELARTLRHVAGAVSNADGVVTNLDMFAAPLKDGEARLRLGYAEKPKQAAREENREKNMLLPRGSARAPAGESVKLAVPTDEHPKFADRGAGPSPAKSAAAKKAAGNKAAAFAQPPVPRTEAAAPDAKAATRETTPSAVPTITTVPTIIVVRVNQPTPPVPAASPPP